MGLGQITKQELTTELYRDLKVELATTPADVEISGRTLVNLLGRVGNAIYKQYNNGATTTDGWRCKITYEGNKFVLTSTETDNMAMSLADYLIGFELKQVLKPSKFYILLADAETDGNCDAKMYPLLDGVENFKMKEIPANSKGTVFCAINTARTTEAEPAHWYVDCCSVAKTVGAVAKFKDIRLYEITEEVYNKINVDAEYTGDKVVEKYPYVDDIKCVVNPYVECNENLIDGKFCVVGSFDADGLPVTDETSLSIFTNKIVKAGETYSVRIQGDYANDFLMVVYGCSGKYESFEIDRGTTGSTQKTFTFITGGVLNIYINNAHFTNGLTIETLKNSINIGATKVVLTKSLTPKTYEECYNSRMMFETKVYDGEKITRDNSGRYIKNSEWDELIIGEMVVASTPPDNKSMVLFTDVSKVNGLYVAYDGKINVANYGENKYFNIILHNNLTGWGNNYIPTTDEIRAFFLGWRMFNGDVGSNSLYTGTGRKGWDKLWCGIGTRYNCDGNVGIVSSQHIYDTCPTVMNDQGYTPYRLIYKKETPTIEEVKTHGSLVVKDGIDVKVSSGLVLGEVAKVSSNNAQIHTNGGDSKWINRCDVPLLVRNDKEHKSFTINKFTGADTIIVYGSSNVWFGERGTETLVEGEKSLWVDYLIYRPDTVTSFLYTITTPQTAQEILEKTIEELSNTNEKLSAENRDLHNKIENLPQVSNPNLLINGDFQIWQRGESFNVGGTYQNYCADRWKYDLSFENTGEIKKTQGGIMFKGLKFWNGVTQIIDLDETPYLRGKTITVSCELLSNPDFDVFLRIGSNETTTRDSHSYVNLKGKTSGKVSYTIPSNHRYLLVWINADMGDTPKDLVVKYIKAEIGDKATPFIPRAYSEELAMCQRYYEKGGYAKYLLNIPSGGLIDIPLKVRKRIQNPSCTITTDVSSLTFNVDCLTGDCIRAWNAGTTALTGNCNMTYIADAEIY